MNFRLVAVAIAASLPGAVMADTVLLDIPDGNGTDIVWTSGSGAKSSFFDISSQNFNFYEPDYGTPGIVYAWDHDSVDEEHPFGTNSTGVLALIANSPSEFRIGSVAFDISGYLTYSSASTVTVWADDVLAYQGDFELAGNSEINSIFVELSGASNVRIELDNTSPWAWTGLDNILVTSMAVPAPGAFALLGVAGIVGKRRRRTA